MALSATQLRKNLFQVLDSVGQGNEIEITHKNATVRIVPAGRASRLSRLIERPGLPLHLDDLPSGWDEQARSQWQAEQDDTLGHAPR